MMHPVLRVPAQVNPQLPGTWFTSDCSQAPLNPVASSANRLVGFLVGYQFQ